MCWPIFSTNLFPPTVFLSLMTLLVPVFEFWYSVINKGVMKDMERKERERERAREKEREESMCVCVCVSKRKKRKGCACEGERARAWVDERERESESERERKPTLLHTFDFVRSTEDR